MGVEAPDFWNVPVFIQKSLYPLATVTMVVFFLGFWIRANIWSLGSDTDNSLRGMGTIGLLYISIAKIFSSECIFASRVFRFSILRGLILVGIMWGFILLFIGTVLRGVHYYGSDYGFHFLVEDVWLWFSLTLDVGGGALLIGVIYSLFRRYLFPPKQMITSLIDGGFLIWLFLVIFTGFLMEGARIVGMNLPAMDWSPVGYQFGLVTSWMVGGNIESIKSIHLAIWIIHVLLSLSFIAYIPYSKGFHMLAAQFTTVLAAERKEEAKTGSKYWIKEDH